MTIRAGYLAAAAILALGAVAAPGAQAGYVITLEEVGSDVVATGSGPIDLTNLSSAGDILASAEITPSGAAVVTGATSFVHVDIYLGMFGPMSLGSGGTTNASSSSGDLVGITNFSVSELAVPSGYISESPLSDTATYDNATFASLGVTPGVYEWTWGTGADQSFTLDVGASPVPEPSTWAMMLIGFGGIGYAGYRTSRKSAALAA
jgi:hypothetical protein